MKTQLIMGLKEQTLELPEILPNILLVSISAQYVGESAPSKILPLLNDIAKDWKLSLSNPLHTIVARRILINSVLNN